MRIVALLALTTFALAAGCHLILPLDEIAMDSRQVGPPDADSRSDTAADAGSDTAVDAGSDSAVDVGGDGPGPGPPKHLWQKAMGGIGLGSEYGYSVAVDSSNNVYLTGRFFGTANLGGGNVTSNGYDIFVTSFSDAGKHRWQKNLAGTGDEVGHGVAVDGSGNVYLTGAFQGTADLGGGDVTAIGSGTEIFVTGFSTAGAHLWQKALGGTGTDVGYGVAVDGSGNVCLTGSFTGPVNLGGGNVTSIGSGSDIFVTSFSSTGTHRWQKNLGGTSTDVGKGVAVDNSGNVYLTGSFSGTADLGGGNVTSNSSSIDVFITSFTAAGKHRWQKNLGGTSTDAGRGVAVDSNNNVYLTGRFFGTADFGGGNVTPKGGSDLFVTSFSAAGKHRWQKALGGTGADAGEGVAVDNSDNVYLTGRFSGMADLGGGNVTSKGGYDIFVTSFSSTGTHRWQKALGGSGDNSGYGVAVDGNGNVYLTGRFMGTADLGGGNVTSNGDSDIFLVKFGP